MRGRFQRRGAACALLAVALLAVPAAAQQTPKPKPRPAPSPTPPPPVLIMPVRPEDRVTAPPVIIPAPPPGAPRRPAVITNPTWMRAPQPEYPYTAIRNGVVEGRVTLQCLTLPDGALTDCRVIQEMPQGQGFADSALAAAARARLSPRTVDGAAVGARVQFTTRYIAPDAPDVSDVLEEPAWAVRPRPVMPRSARRARIETAQVRLSCEIVPGFGRMRNCRVLQDGPEGHGFGEAAIQAVRGAEITEEWLARAGPNTRAIVTITFRR